ncbi:hypothetical protein [Reinekea sp. G2M2-21]|uniref:hypothetical protein n=1 Tax=Reinekea sp. G2M2-21 TaxID=2788942 RepID=UPI0018AADF93|nr:hypothetical protein [Reinekea sp. G2M2-21]
MRHKELIALITKLEDSWNLIDRLDRIKMESTFGVDLVDGNQELCDRIHTALLHDNYRKQVNRIPLGIWVAYLSMISAQRFISTLWLLSERIPGFIHKLTLYCDASSGEHSKFVLKRFGKICRRALYEEALNPKIMKVAISESK